MLINKFRKSIFAKDVIILSTGTTIAQIISVCSIPVITRLYSPSDFGILAIFSAFVGIAGTLFSFRYESAIVPAKQEDEASALVKLTMYLSIGSVLLALIIMVILPSRVFSWIHMMPIFNWRFLAICAGGLVALGAIATAWHNRIGSYKKIALARVISTLVMVTVVIILGTVQISNGQIWGSVVSSIIVVTILWHGIKFNKKIASDFSIIKLITAHAAAPKFLLPTALLDVITQQLPIILLTSWFSSALAGQFSVAWRVLALPMSLIGGAVSQVFFQRFSQVWPDKSAARHLLYSTWKYLAFLGIIPTLIAMFWGGPLFSLILGSQWRESGIIASVIAPMLLVMFVSSPTSTSYIVLGLQRYSLIFGILVLFFRPMALFIGYYFNNIILGLLILVIFEIIQIVSYNLLLLKKL